MQLEQEKNRLLVEAKEEARQQVEEIMQEAETIITNLRQLATKEEPVKDHLLIEAKKNLELAKERLTNQGTEKPMRKGKAKQGSLKPGDEVYVHTFGQKGHILEQVSTKEYLVQIGIMKMKVEREELEKIKAQQTPTIQTRPSVIPLSNLLN